MATTRNVKKRIKALYESVARGSQRVGMSTVEAVDRKISWLFCFVSHECTVSARFLHGQCFPCPMM